MEIEFPGGVRVDAVLEGLRIRTDQPRAQGGGGEAPSPFDLFLASIGTCAGFYALRFLQERGLDTEGLALSLTTDWDTAHKHVVRVGVRIALPATFPDKYREAILRAVDQCSVKRHLAAPPILEVTTARESSVPAR